MFPEDSSHAHSVLSSLNQQRALGRFCDATLDVGDGVAYMAHRNVLACFSELFRDDHGDAPGRTLRLQECPNDGLELLLNFVYTGELKLDALNLDNVRRAAASLCVPQALALCQSFGEIATETVPAKRKRGRPKKSTPVIQLFCSLKDEADASQPSADAISDPITDDLAMTGSSPAATAKVTAVTRSGRKVKGPRRLLGESPDLPPPDKGALNVSVKTTDSNAPSAPQSPVQSTIGDTEV